MNQAEYNQAVYAHMAQTRQAHEPTSDAESVPSVELGAVRAAMKAARIDPDGAVGQRLEDLWVADGLDAAIAAIVTYKAEQVATVAALKAQPRQPAYDPRYKSATEARLAETATFFGDDGRPLARPLRDKNGKPLP